VVEAEQDPAKAHPLAYAQEGPGAYLREVARSVMKDARTIQGKG